MSEKSDYLDKQVETYAQLCIRQIDRCMSTINRIDFTEGFSRSQLIADNINYLESLIAPLIDEELEKELKGKDKLEPRIKLSLLVKLLYRKGVLNIRYTDEVLSDSSSDESTFPFDEVDEEFSSEVEPIE